MKNIFRRYKTIMMGFFLMLVGIVIGIGINSYYPLILRSSSTKKELISQPNKVVSASEEKKQSLGKFYNEIIKAQDNEDWNTLYKFLPQSIKNNLTLEQFISYEGTVIGNAKQVYSKSQGKIITNFVSKNTIVNSIKINGDKGIVNRTIITCITEECIGKNRTEVNANKPYEYIDGKWQLPDPEPSERALKASNYGYEESSKNDQAEILKDYGYGTDNSTFAIRNWAVYLDQNLQELIRLETLIEKNKAERSRPVYYQQPAQIIQQQSPVVQQQTYPKNCTSNTIGNYTYTNCY